MAFKDNMRATVDKLIKKYGMDLILHEAVPGEYDPATGKNATTFIEHKIKGHVEPYRSSEIIEGVINIDDLKILIYADNWSLSKDWYLSAYNEAFEIVNWTAIMTQNAPITMELQCRSRNA